MTTTIAISPIGRQQDSSSEVIQLNIAVIDPTLFALYSRIELWRSVMGEGGPYDPLTGYTQEPAQVPRKGVGFATPMPPAGPSVVVVGKTLEALIRNEERVSVTFTGTDPLTYAAVALQIQAQGRGLVTAFVSSTGRLVLQTTEVGPTAFLRVLSSDAASLLKLPADSSEGKDAHLNLIEGQTEYWFQDLYGSVRFHYKIRFLGDNNVVSEYSLPHSVGSQLGLTHSSLIRGVARLVQGDGKPLINQTVHVHCEFTGSLIENAVVSGTDLEQKTDWNGNVEFSLIRGQKFTVSVPGTSLYRSITAPTDVNKAFFNLFDPDVSDGNDTFKVQVPQIVIAERRSL